MYKRQVQNGAIFIALKEIVISPKYFQYIRNVILTSSIFSLFVLAFFEISNLGVGGVRIGDSLSGNVNVAGANFGILSIFMVYICEKQKKIFNWIILAFVVGVMLLTGSKMTLIILALDLVYFFINSKNKGVTLLLVIGEMCIRDRLMLPEREQKKQPMEHRVSLRLLLEKWDSMRSI